MIATEWNCTLLNNVKARSMDKAFLENALRKSNVAFVVGSGVSISATQGNPFASWKGLLASLAEHASRYLNKATTDRLIEQIHSSNLNSMVSAAEELTLAIGGRQQPEFAIWLENTIGTLQIKDSRITDFLIGTEHTILTTNYDSLLSEAIPPVPWTESKTVEKVMSGEEEGIIHLHGHYKTPESVILGAASYEDIVHNDFSQSMQKAIGMLHSLVFIGCGMGLEDPNFGPFLDWASKIKSQTSIPWFILAKKSDAIEIKQRWGFLVVVVYGEKHSDLPEFLATLDVPIKKQIRLQKSSAVSIDSQIISENSILKEVLSRLVHHQSSSITLKSWHLQHIVHENGDSTLFERACVAANESSVYFFRRKFSTRHPFLGGDYPIVEATDEEGIKLPCIKLEAGEQWVECAAILEPPLKPSETRSLLLTVSRRGIWKRLLVKGTEDNKIEFRYPATHTVLEFIAPKGFRWTRLISSPSLGKIEIKLINELSTLIWELKNNLQQQEIRYTLMLKKD